MVLDGELLATLGTTTRKDGAATLGCHTGTETVRLCALELVRLVRTLHDASSWEHGPAPMGRTKKPLSRNIIEVGFLTCQ